MCIRDRPYPKEEKETPYEGFTYREIVPVEDTIHLPLSLIHI